MLLLKRRYTSLGLGLLDADKSPAMVTWRIFGRHKLAYIDWLTQTCDALLKSCEVLFYGEKTGFLAKSTLQPPVLEQKSTSQVAALLATRFLQVLLCSS